MESTTIDSYAATLAQLCLPLSSQQEQGTTAPIDDTRIIVERWLSAPGWTDQPSERRAKALICFARTLCDLNQALIPLEWLIFPLNVSRGLHMRGAQTVQCAEALRRYAMALQFADHLPTCDFTLGLIDESPPNCCMVPFATPQNGR